MENIQQGFAIVRWWIGLKAQDKLIAFLLSVVIALTTSLINVLGTNGILQEKNLNRTIECEQRVASSVAWQRNRDDSLRDNDNKNCELEKQDIYNRVGIIKQRNDKIQKAIK